LGDSSGDEAGAKRTPELAAAFLDHVISGSRFGLVELGDR
jgi:hypothetical protein